MRSNSELSSTRPCGIAEPGRDVKQRLPAFERQEALRSEYHALTIGLLHAQLHADQERERVTQAALDEFVTAHRDLVTVFRRAAQAALAQGNPDVAQAERARQRQEARQQARDAWEARPHSHLTDRGLAAEIGHQRERAAQAAQSQAAAAERVVTLALQVQDGHGPHVQAVEDRVAELARRAALAAEHDRLAGEYQARQVEMTKARMDAIGKQVQADQLTRWDSVLHPGRREQLHAEAAERQRQAEHQRSLAHERAYEPHIHQRQTGATNITAWRTSPRCRTGWT